jgi:hypothetical protein
MIDSVDYDYGLFARPLYSYAEADRLGEVSRGTSNRWVKGYKYWILTVNVSHNRP